MALGRSLRIEALETRLPFATQGFISLASQVPDLAINRQVDNGVIGELAPRLRQLSYVHSDQLHWIDLNAGGAELQRQHVTMQLPAGASSLVLQYALDADTAVGLADFGGVTEAVLWIKPERPISLGASWPIAAFQHVDGTVDVVVESHTSLQILRYDRQGAFVQQHTLQSDVYSAAQFDTDGGLLLGEVNDIPRAAWIDRDFQVTEVELAVPTGAVRVTATGLTRLSGRPTIVGTWLDGQGLARVLGWSQDGEIVYTPSWIGTSVVKASGNALLVESPTGQAIVVFDEQLAQSLKVPGGEPINVWQLFSESKVGWSDVLVRDIVEANRELFLSVSGVEASEVIEHAIWAQAATYFPSAWQNRGNVHDVDRSGQVTPLDALLVINRLNSMGAGQLTGSELVDAMRYDVSGDGLVTPIDVLLVINRLNAGSGEGEASPVASPTATADYWLMLPPWEHVTSGGSAST